MGTAVSDWPLARSSFESKLGKHGLILLKFAAVGPKPALSSPMLMNVFCYR